MDFRQFATKETSALVERLTAAAAAQAEDVREQARADAQKDIDIVRSDLKERAGQNAQLEASLKERTSQIEQLEASLKERTSQIEHLEASLKERTSQKEHLGASLKERTSQKEHVEASLKERTSQNEQLEASLKKRTSQNEQLKASLEEMTRQKEHVEASLKERTSQNKQLEASLEEVTRQKGQLEKSLRELRAQADALRAELRTAVDHAETARVESVRARKAQEKADNALREAEAVRLRDAQAKATVDTELQEVHTAFDEMRAGATATERARRDLEVKLNTAVSNAKMLRQKVAEAEEETVRVRAEADLAMQEFAATSARQPLDRLLMIFDQLAKAKSTADVLTTLVDALAIEFSRVAVFSVSGKQLKGMHQVGFDVKRNISKVVVPIAMDSLLTKALASGRVQGAFGSEITDSSSAPFGGKPTFVLTLPIPVRGDTLAVIYADNSDPHQTAVTADRGVKFAELLLWHAVPMLTKLSARLESVAG